MTDLRALLGDKYDEVIERAVDVTSDISPDYFGCGCCSFYDYDAALERTGHGDRVHMAMHDALAAVLPDLLARAWDEGHWIGKADAALNAVRVNAAHVVTPNPYRTEGETHE